ncbi:hypothetical protein TNCV_1792001 [Trichonephila clavipes]|nr:hypothetical protein TNCV_1792001 [Trichonephila clavipes]
MGLSPVPLKTHHAEGADACYVLGSLKLNLVSASNFASHIRWHRLLVEILTHAQHLTFFSDSLVSRRREGDHCPLLNMQANKKEQQGVIRFLAAERVGSREAHQRVKTVFDEYSLPHSSAVEWH